MSDGPYVMKPSEEAVFEKARKQSAAKSSAATHVKPHLRLHYGFPLPHRRDAFGWMVTQAGRTVAGWYQDSAHALSVAKEYIR